MCVGLCVCMCVSLGLCMCKCVCECRFVYVQETTTVKPIILYTDLKIKTEELSLLQACHPSCSGKLREEG